MYAQVPFALYAQTCIQFSYMAEKSERLIIRIEPQQRAQFGGAAKAASKNVSAWLRDLGAAAVSPPAPSPFPVLREAPEATPEPTDGW
jgi:hypothetical protein